MCSLQRVCHLKKMAHFLLYLLHLLQNFTTMGPIIDKFRKINRELRYGVIYVVTSLGSSFSRVSDSDSNIVPDSLSPRLIEWLGRLTGFDVEVVEVPGAEETKLVARRINVGNAGKDAVVEMPLHYSSFSDVMRFAQSATDVLSTDEGDQMLEQEGYLDSSMGLDDYCNKFTELSRYLPPELNEPVQKAILKQCASKESRSLSFKKKTKRAKRHDIEFLPSSSDPLSRADVELEEEQELLTIEQEREQALNDIQAQILEYVTTYQADPKELIEILLKGKIVIGNNRLSPLVVNNDLKIVLPYYNEVEVKMPAMCRAIYILFLKHPKGIALRDIGDYRTELDDIYSMVMPGKKEALAKAAIDNLLDPMSNTLNEYISKIKRCFKLCIIDDQLASNYIITGKRGEPYRITLAPSLITLPRAVIGTEDR